MAVSTKIIDFFDRRAVSEKRALRHQRDLAVKSRDQWRRLAEEKVRDCSVLRAERDEARAQLGFANEEIARMTAEVRRLKAELQSARVGRAAADRDVLKYLDALAALEAELIDRHGWTQERCDEFTGLGEKDEPMKKQDVAEEVGHDRYRGLVEDAAIREAEGKR